jgi:hypothetical protein
MKLTSDYITLHSQRLATQKHASLTSVVVKLFREIDRRFIFLAVVTAIYQVYRILTLCSSSVRSASLHLYAQQLVDKEVTNRSVINDVTKI